MKIKPHFALYSVFALILGAMPSLALSAPTSTLVPGTLSVCFYPGLAPFAEKQADGSWTGWDVEYLETFANSAGLSFEVVEIPAFKGIWNEPGADRCDIAGTEISDLQERRMDTGPAAQWSQHYYSVASAFLVRGGDESKLKSVQDLAGKSIIVTEDSTAHHDILNRINIANVQNVKIGFTQNEIEAAKSVHDATSAEGPFAYGGGLGSVQTLASSLGGLSVVWTHCDMFADGTERNEPFSFVVRAKSTGIITLLNEFIEMQKAPYPGGKGPILACPGGDP